MVLMVATACCFRRRFLPIIGSRAVLAKKVFVQQYLLHGPGGRRKMQRFTRQLNEVFQHRGVMNSVFD